MSQWIQDEAVREGMRQAGVPTSEFVLALAGACLREGVRASGFLDVIIGQPRRANDRAPVEDRLWRVLERASEGFPLEDPDARKRFTLIVNWRVGAFGFVFDDNQEKWSAVVFDEISVRAWLSRIQAGTVNPVTADEIKEFVKIRVSRPGGPGDNINGWKDFQAQHGARAKGVSPAFKIIWGELTGRQGRGRPPKS